MHKITVYDLLTLKCKYTPYIGLLGVGLFSKLYYDNNTQIKTLSAENILDYPLGVKTKFDAINDSILPHALRTHGYKYTNIKIPSKLFDNDKHLFRSIKTFKNECTDNHLELSTSAVFERCKTFEKQYNHLHEIDDSSKFSIGKGNECDVIMRQKILLPDIIMCQHPTCEDKNMDRMFYYGNSNIYLNSPIIRLDDIKKIKDLFVDAGYHQVAEKIACLSKNFNTDTKIAVYTQKIETDTVYMNVTQLFDDNTLLPIYHVNIITDDKETLVKKSMEKCGDNRKFYQSMIIFSLCVLARNFLPF